MKNLPPMKYVLGQKVIFKCKGKICRGKIFVADFGGSLEHDYHSYDLDGLDKKMLYKHVPECDILEEIKDSKLL